MNWELISLFLLICLLLSSFVQGFMSGRFSKRQLAMAVIAVLSLTIVPMSAFLYWRDGVIVAQAEFNPGIAPFTVEVRRVPVPVTHSAHFIATLSRGKDVVTSFRFFWPNYTPRKVQIDWPCVNHFTITFDDKYKAGCDWAWGKSANWSMHYGALVSPKPGLSEYFFKPRSDVPPGCPVPQVE